jgi:predicted nucleic acid-binding protein
MAWLIYDIRTAKPQSGFRYLFDANIWLAVLDTTFSHRTLQPYIDFFDSIINETDVRDATIAVPATLLSEVINRMMRDVFYKEFVQTNTPVPGERNHFKNVYRKHPQYKIDLDNTCALIRAYHRKIEFVSDGIDQYKCRDLIKNIPVHLDINDYLYSKMALQQGLVIVTNDTDFAVEDIHIITSQQALLQLNTPGVNP